MSVRVVGFDGDDTLWHSETRFHVTQGEFRELLKRHVRDADVDARLAETEMKNLAIYGYGVKSFTLSRDLVMETDAMYQSAKKASHMPLAVKSIREQRGNYELLARITGELDEKPEVVVNVQTTQEWIAIRSVVFESLEDYPEVRSEISLRLRALADGKPDPGHAEAERIIAAKNRRDDPSIVRVVNGKVR